MATRAPEAAYEALRQVAFDEGRKIHDLLMEGVELALKKTRIFRACRLEGKVGAQEVLTGDTLFWLFRALDRPHVPPSAFE